MKTPKLVERFKEVTGIYDDSDGYVPVDDGANRVQKEAYVCKRMKISRSQLIELCYCTGIDTLYDELRRKGGKR